MARAVQEFRKLGSDDCIGQKLPYSDKATYGEIKAILEKILASKELMNMSPIQMMMYNSMSMFAMQGAPIMGGINMTQTATTFSQ